MKSYLIIFLFFINPCIAMEQTNETKSPFVWNDGIMRDLREKIIGYYLLDQRKLFKPIFEKIKITFPFATAYNISPNGNYYVTCNKNDKSIEVWDIKTRNKVKQLLFHEQVDIDNFKKLHINDDASWLVIEESDRFHSIPMEKDSQNVSDLIYDMRTIFHNTGEEQINPEQMHFHNDRLLIAGKKKAGLLRKEGLINNNIFKDTNDDEFLSCLFDVQKPSKNSTSYHAPFIFSDSTHITFSSANKQLFIVHLDQNKKIFGVGPFSYVLPENLNMPEATASYDPILSCFYFTNQNKTIIQELNCTIRLPYKFIHLESKIINKDKKISYGISHDNYYLHSRNLYYEKDKISPTNGAIPFLKLENKKFNCISDYLVFAPQEEKGEVELYPSKSVSYLTERYYYEKNNDLKTSTFNDAQLFLLLALEEAAQKNEPVELKEIMESAYNTMPCQIRTLYEHLIAKNSN